jgi:hypothetical protein
MRGMRNSYKILGKLKGRDGLEDLAVDGKITDMVMSLRVP